MSVITGVLSAVLNLSRPILFGLIVDSLIVGKHERLVYLIIIYAFSWVFTWSLSILVQYLCSKVSQKILMDLRNKVFAHYLALPFIKVENIKQGKMESIIMSDLPGWTNIYGTVLAQVVHSIAQLIGAVIAMSNVNVYLTIIIIPFLVLSFIIPWFMRKKLQKISYDTQESKANTLEGLTGMIQGIQDLISLSKETWGKKIFKNSTQRIYHNEIKQDILSSYLRISGSISETAAYILILSVGSILIYHGEIAIGELITVLATIELLFYPVRSAGELFGSIQYSIGAASRVWEFLDIPIKTNDTNPTSSFEFENVNFNYSIEKQTLTDITFSVNHGELIVVVGESGSGKSTLLKLIAGLYTPTDGTIRYFNDDIVGKKAVVWQEPFLYNVPLRENLSFNASFNEGEINLKVKELNLDMLINSLPEKYNTIVRNNGGNFSGGQKRRLAILRAILLNPNLLILDEPTGGLDKANKIVINTEISKTENVTRIVSTHDYDIAERADRVIVLANGKIVEMGEPKKLLAVKGAFFKLFFNNKGD